MRYEYDFIVTTQGPAYPPSEVGDANGNFVVIGLINENCKTNASGETKRAWGMAIVNKKSPQPPFGELLPYTIDKRLSLAEDGEMILYTLPSPLYCNNYPHVSSPFFKKHVKDLTRPAYPLHLAPIQDETLNNTRQLCTPITLSQWCKARGKMLLDYNAGKKVGYFNIDCTGLIPYSLYSVISLKQNDLLPYDTTRPEPLGLPNIFVTDADGNGNYNARINNPFLLDNPILNVAILFMSSQMNYGGAISGYGLGIDIHVQLKLEKSLINEMVNI